MVGSFATNGPVVAEEDDAVKSQEIKSEDVRRPVAPLVVMVPVSVIPFWSA